MIDPTAVPWAGVTVVVDLVLVGLSAWHILLNKREAASALLWLNVVVLLPIVGTLTYVAFGVDRHGRRATVKELHNLAARRQLDPEGPRHLPAPLRSDGPDASCHGPLEADLFPAYLDPFASLLSRIGRYRAVGDNDVELLVGGDAFFDRALEAIGGATASVLLETYIFDSDPVGAAFLDALGEAAERGVRCALLYDALGSIDLDAHVLQRARIRGVDVRAFDQRSRVRGRFQINLRNHRKILVIDGVVGFTGGANISALHRASEPIKTRSDDIHVVVQGPVVTQLGAVFAEDWYSSTGELLGAHLDVTHAPALQGAICRVLPSGPDGDHGAFHKLIVAAIHGAREHVDLVTPYFIPSQAVTIALQVAAMRGVQVRLLLPEQADHWFVQQASNAYLGALLDAGVQILRRPPPFLHAKAAVIDGLWALVGSSNIDPRGFWLNYELNMGIAGPAAVQPIQRWVDSEIAAATPLDAAAWRMRGLGVRAWENFWALFSPLL